MTSRADSARRLPDLFDDQIQIEGNFAVSMRARAAERQQQTNDMFSAKWEKYERSDEKDRLFEFQRRWYLKLYGFETEAALARHLRPCEVIFDAGCGLGYKAAWFATLAPHALVIGMDFSDAAAQAARTYDHLENLYFVRGDIADTGLRTACVDYTSCDQVIMHTENPTRTFGELARLTAARGQLACYFYAKKALPRELLDEHFRSRCRELSREQLWAMAEQLTELGRRLSELKVEFDAPDIPELGIKGGRYDIQRFLYWNFLKCFWNADLGLETSVVTNFDWYSPSNARRFSKAEVLALLAANRMHEVFFHSEEACHSGRFAHDG
jgi:SAM-dependent methyltransferase